MLKAYSPAGKHTGDGNLKFVILESPLPKNGSSAGMRVTLDDAISLFGCGLPLIVGLMQTVMGEPLLTSSLAANPKSTLSSTIPLAVPDIGPPSTTNI